MEKLDFNKSLNKNKSIFIIGKRSTGKTTLINDILKFKNNPNGIIISDFEEYNPEILEYVFNKQNNNKRKYNENDKNFYLVLDDCLFENTHFQNIHFQNLITENKNLKLDFIISKSFLNIYPSILNQNIDLIFIFKDHYIPNLKRIYNQFGGFFESFESFTKQLNDITNIPYNCMVLDNTNNKIFWYNSI
jgi:AAA+ ATPase superfamily predicted ATPase